MAGCIELARRVGEELASELGVPVYLYEAAATRPERKSLADIRSGEYEALPAKLLKSEWKPDFGPAAFVPGWGATVVGAREFLIAYNVNLNTRDKRLANEIALNIREAGRAAKDPSGNPLKDSEGRAVKKPGRLREVRAIGWYIESYRCAQVSINLLDYKTTPLHIVFETAKEEAEKLGLLVTGSEIVGLVPREPIVAAGRHFLSRMGRSEGVCEAELVETALRSMGLDSVSAFDPAKKIVEYAGRPEAPLAALRVAGFVDEVSSDSPAPGGGSVAALSGSLGAALAAMVANLIVGKKGFEAEWKDLSSLATRAQDLKAALVAAIDEDTAAFNKIMDALKLPKAGEAQATARETALQLAYVQAAAVPLETAAASLEALRLCVEVAARGNPASASDAGVGAIMAKAGIEAACLNVLINLVQVRDRAKAEAMGERARSISEEGGRLEAEALERVKAAIGRA